MFAKKVGFYLELIFPIVLCAVISTKADPAGTFTTTKIGPKPIWNATFTDKLRHDLLLNYDKFARPTQHYNKTTVYFDTSIRHIEINEFRSTITVHSYTKLTWNDDKLKWNSSDYGGLSSLNLGDHEIWQPDIFLYNSATAAQINNYGNTLCIVFEDGKILWVPPTQYTALCEFNLKFWPFDTHTCKLQFGSWTYHGDQIDLRKGNNNTAATVSLIIENPEWEILNIDSKLNLVMYECCPEPYPDISVYLTVHRKSPAYKTLIISPAFAIILLILMNFWLPPQAGEKILLNGCTAIIITMFLLYFSQKIPAIGMHTPLIVLFYSSSLYIVCFSMANAILVLWLSRSRHSKPVPWILKQPLTGCLGKWLGLGNISHQTSINTIRSTAEEMRDHQVTEFEEHNTNDDHQMIGCASSQPIHQDWILLATAIDRLSFIFYAFLFGILSIAYSL